jgi:hypothetical protein
MLRRYGESSTGEAISRDILVPSDMPLHNIHYAIQKLFGWQNSHLRRFILPEDVYQKLTGNTVKGWSDLVGVLFQPPSEAEDDIFWDEDYERGSFYTWMKKKYSGPYYYGGYLENPEAAKQDIQELLNHFKMVEVRESFRDYMERLEKGNNDKEKIIRKAPLIELTLDEMNSSIVVESGTESLLERLEINSILAVSDEEIDPSKLFPVTTELIYNYDFGDNWLITITKHKDCNDLLEQNLIDDNELEEAEDTVWKNHKPVCINKDGVSVLDDIGGLGGFAEFLWTIYECEDKQERENTLRWAKSLGWSDKKVSCKSIL